MLRVLVERLLCVGESQLYLQLLVLSGDTPVVLAGPVQPLWADRYYLLVLFLSRGHTGIPEHGQGKAEYGPEFRYRARYARRILR